MHPQRLLNSSIGNTPYDNKESSSLHPNNIEDHLVLVHNSYRLSNDLAFDEIPGFDEQEPPTNPGTSSEISGLRVDKHRRAYTARLSEIE